MGGIDCIEWGDVGPHDYEGARGRLFAFWPPDRAAAEVAEPDEPEPVADWEEAWESEFEAILHGLVASLGRFGEPSRIGEMPVWRQSLVARLLGREAPDLRLSEHLALVAHDDQFDPAHVRFGTPVRAVVWVSDGRPIVWIWLDDSVADTWPEHSRALVASGGADKEPLADGRELCEKTPKWDRMLPGYAPFSAT